MSDNLGVGRVAAGMDLDAIGAKANDMSGALDAALTNPGTFTIDGTNTLTLTAAQFIGNVGFQIDPAGSPPIGASTLTVPSTNAAAATLKRGLFAVINGLAQTLAVQVSGQALTAPVLAADTWGLFYMDGSDVRQLTAGAVGGGGDGTFVGLTDTPASFSGHAGKRVAVKSDASGLEFTEAGGTDAADWKESCRFASTANLTLSGEQTIDGGSAVTGDRVLAKDQTTGSERGIYVVAVGAWSRAEDADASDEVTSGLTVTIEEGTVNGGKEFKLTTPDPITLGSTALTFEESAGTVVSDNAFFVYTKKPQADHTLTVSDVNRWLAFNNTGAKTVTVPPHSDAKIGINSEIVVQWHVSAANGLTIVAGSGVTINAPNGLVLPSQFSWALLKKTASNRWTVQIVPASGGGGTSAMDDLSDADMTTAAPAAGDVMVFDGTNWVPKGGVNAQTGTTYTLALADNLRTVTLDNASAIALTVPPNSGVAFPVGAVVSLMQKGAGQVTVAGDTGVTVNKPSANALTSRAQWSTLALTKLATDTWVLSGDMT